MNDPAGKRLLAAVRGGDFAHAGEAEAIDLAWEGLPRDPNQACLDAGCGRGGTAAYVWRSGWGNVTGIDIDAESVAEAAAAYPQGNFLALDVAAAGTRFPASFDLIYAFNAFYAFPDQPQALASLRAAARPEAILCLFDYVDRGNFPSSPFAATPESSHWQPMRLAAMPNLLAAAGWEMTACRELHDEYLRWYKNLNARFTRLRPDLEKDFSRDLVAQAVDVYASLLAAINDGSLGGALVCARAR